MFDRIARTLRPARRRLAAVGAAAALAAGSLLAPHAAAADTAYPVHVTFDSVRFHMVDDGVDCSHGLFSCTGDGTLELYGTVGAYTTAGASSAGGGWPYRIFGRWGTDWCEVSWTADGDTGECAKRVPDGTYDFTKVLLCAGSQYQTCSMPYGKDSNTVPLNVRPGEQFKVTVAMQDYDKGSANDSLCVGNLWFGPYTATELYAKKFVFDSVGKTIFVPDNGNGECQVFFHLS